MKFFKPALHGYLDGDKLIKKNKSVVLFKIYDGFGVPVRVLNQVRSVEVHYQNEVYTAPVTMFKQHGIEHRFKDEDQLVLPRRFWHITTQYSLFEDDNLSNERI